MTIYITRYHKLCFIKDIDLHKTSIQKEMISITNELSKEVLDCSNMGIDEPLSYITERFCDIEKEFVCMIEILNIKKKNTKDYIDNNAMRFKECVELYESMLSFANARGIDLTSLKKKDSSSSIIVDEPALAAMY